MSENELLTEWLDQHIRWPRANNGFDSSLFYNRFDAYPLYPHSRPSAEDLADSMLADLGFRSLQLGTWLGTPDGQMLTAAIEAVSPPFYQPDIELLTEALRLAAATQRNVRLTRLAALGTAGVALLLITSVAGRRT